MAASLPVVIASNQTNVPENITQIAGAAPSATNPLPERLTDGTSFYDARQIRALVNTDVVKAQIQDNAGTAITVGQKTMSSSVPVVMASDQTPIPVQTWGPSSHWQRINTNTTTTLKSGAGFLRRIIKSGAGQVTIYDNTAGSGTTIQAFSSTAVQNTIVYDIPFTTGLTIVTSSGPDIVVVWD